MVAMVLMLKKILIMALCIVKIYGWPQEVFHASCTITGLIAVYLFVLFTCILYFFWLARPHVCFVCLYTMYTSLCHYHTNDVPALGYWWPLFTIPLLHYICNHCDILRS